VCWEEALLLAVGLERLHLPLSSARRLVRILGGVIQSFVMAMFDDAIQNLPKMLD
jgi:lauroyl/myristoyl acyltransferase